MPGRFIIIGENVHCSRVRSTTGRFVDAAQGRPALLFQSDGRTCRLPVPEDILAGGEWAGGRVRPVAVAVRQGLCGRCAEQEAGCAFLRALAREQEAAGAHFLDLNVDEYSQDPDEKLRAMTWAAGQLQRASSLPLSLDSSNPGLLEAGLAACDPARGRPLVNSVSLERAALIPAAASRGARVVAGASGLAHMPEAVADRLENLARVLDLLKAQGIALADTFLDPLVFPIAVDGASGRKVFETIRACRAQYGPAVHFAPGFSNVSFGLPRRTRLNQVFAHLCQAEGCDGGLADPAQINDAILAGLDPRSEPYRLSAALLQGADEDGMHYLAAAREGTL